MQFRGQVDGSSGRVKIHLLAAKLEEVVKRGWKNRLYGVTLILPVNIDQSHCGATLAVANGPNGDERKCVGGQLGDENPSKVLGSRRRIPANDIRRYVLDNTK